MAPTISVQRSNVAENNGTISGTIVSFTVSLSESADQDVRFSWRVLPGTATAGDLDHSIDVYTAIIPAGSTEFTINIEAYGDTLDEADESIWLELFNPLNAGFANGQTTQRVLGVIQDNDGSSDDLALFVSDPIIKEGHNGTQKAVFEVHLSRPAGTELTFSYETVDGTAKAGSDYVAKSGTVTFLPGQTTVLVEVNIKGDRAVEPSEFFSLVVTPTGDIHNDTAESTGTATIIDDDAGRPTLTILPAEVVENDGTISGRWMAFRVQLSEATDRDIKFNWQLTPGTIIWGDLDLGAGVREATISAGDTSVLLWVEAYGDTTTEVDESLSIEIFNPENASLAGNAGILRATGIILDNDGGLPSSKRALFVSDATLVEGQTGKKTMVFEVTLSRPLDEAITLDYKTVDGSATAGSDYVAKIGSLTFEAGQTRASVEVEINGDRMVEASEFFSLVVSPNDDIRNGTDGSTGIGTIVDNDTSRPTISVERAQVAENNGGISGTWMAFRVSLSQASDETISVNYRFANGTTIAGDFDGMNGGTLTFAPGKTIGIIWIEAYGDTTPEFDESVWIELFDPTNARLAGGERELRALGIVRDNDGGLPSSKTGLFVSEALVTEGDGNERFATFEIHLSRPLTERVSLSYTTANGTAKAGSDYVKQTGAVVFEPGQTIATVQVRIKGDARFEGDETFSLVVSPNGDIKNGTDANVGIATIVNDDSIHETIRGGNGNDVLRGENGNDKIYGRGGNDRLFGDNGNDRLFGEAGNDRLTGGAGNDILKGGGGRDVLNGGRGADKLIGGAGADKLTGGTGSDKLTGGGGADIFVFTSAKDSTPVAKGRDTITDFKRGQGDRIDLSGIDANENRNRDQAFDFIGKRPFSETAGELRVVKQKNATIIQGDTDGDGRADFSILLDDALNLAARDFIL